MYKTKKILRNIIFILLFVFIGLIIWGYIRILPSDIQFTNVSSSSFTVSWNTKFPTKGAAVVIDNKNRIPVSLSLGQVNSYDTRDVKSAELVSTFETANNIWNGDSYKVDINDFVKELIISEKGTYYTHHIQVNGLDPEKSYSVMVGDGIFLFNSKYFSDIADINTVSIPENIKTPVPVYGQIKDAKHKDIPVEDLSSITDGVVYFNFFDELTKERSNVFSSPLNENGNWYIDASGAIDKNGDAFIDKYWGGTISNIWGELVFDLGTLGKWSKTVDVTRIAPVETIVINMTNAVNNDDNPEVLHRIDTLSNPFVKGASASGCLFMNFCGPCTEKVNGKWASCNCDENTLKSRKCTRESNIPIEKAIDNISEGECSGGAKKGDRVQYNGVCKECGIEKSGYWTTLSGVKCENTTGAIFTPIETPPGGGNTSCSVDTPYERIINSADGDPCCLSGKEGTVDLITRSCVVAITSPEGSIETPPGGGNTSCSVDTPYERIINSANGDPCCLSGKEGTVDLTTRSCVVVIEPSSDGKPCVDSSKNIAYGVYDTNGVCNPRDGSNAPLISESDLNRPCYEKTTKLYATTSSGKMYSCKGGEWVLLHDSDAFCEEGGLCGDFMYSLNQCLSTSGVLLDCNRGEKGGFYWTTETGATERGALLVSEIKGKEPCSTEDVKCLCMTNMSYIEPGDICPEVTSCRKGVTEGKVCNVSGNTCHYDSLDKCTGEKINVNLNKRFNIDAIAQGLEKSDYIIDQSTGKILGIQAGQYIVKSGNETYAFQIKEQDVPNGIGDIFVYIDVDKNGEFNENTDKKITDLGQNISIQSIKKEYKFSLKAGFNFVSFPFLIDEESARTAAGLLKMLNIQYFDSVYSIAKYDSNWKIVGQNVLQYDNNDFQLIPGQGYIIKANKDIDITIVGRPIQFDSASDNAAISLFPGWNLIGTYGTNVKQYTAKSLIQSINSYKPVDFTADNVSRWESDVQRYDGFQITNQNGIDIEYGFDFPINNLQSYFVRILNGKGNWQPDVAK